MFVLFISFTSIPWPAISVNVSAILNSQFIYIYLWQIIYRNFSWTIVKTSVIIAKAMSIWFAEKSETFFSLTDHFGWGFRYLCWFFSYCDLLNFLALEIFGIMLFIHFFQVTFQNNNSIIIVLLQLLFTFRIILWIAVINAFCS